MTHYDYLRLKSPSYPIVKSTTKEAKKVFIPIKVNGEDSVICKWKIVTTKIFFDRSAN